MSAISILVRKFTRLLPISILIFGAGLSTVIWILVFLFVPETSQLTLEQIDDLFVSGRKASKTSTSRNKLIAKGITNELGGGEYTSKRFASQKESSGGMIAEN